MKKQAIQFYEVDPEEFKKEITKDDQLNTLDEVGSKIEMWLKSIK